MLRWRLLLGTVFVAGLVGLCWLDAQPGQTGRYLFPLALALTALATQETVALLAAAGTPCQPWASYVWSCGIVAASGAALLRDPVPGGPFAPVALASGLALVGALGREVFSYQAGGGALERLRGTAFAVVYVAGCFTFLVQLRLLRVGGLEGTGPLGGAGLAAIGAMVAVVKSCDTGAYVVGRLCGTHKLAPRLSPGKTIEGLAGGLAFACGAAWLTLGWLLPLGSTPVGWPGWLAFGLVVGGASVVGDLAESLLKRQAGQKDSSRWMPGFGGVLDVVDSLLLAAPVAYLLLASGWIG